MAGDLVLLGPLDQAAQAQIAVGVGTALFGADVDLAAIFAVHLGLGGGRFGHGFLAVLKGPAHSIVLLRDDEAEFYETGPGWNSLISLCQRAGVLRFCLPLRYCRYIRSCHGPSPVPPCPGGAA